MPAHQQDDGRDVAAQQQAPCGPKVASNTNKTDPFHGKKNFLPPTEVGSKLNLLWVVGPGYCFGLTPTYLSTYVQEKGLTSYYCVTPEGLGSNRF